MTLNTRLNKKKTMKYFTLSALKFSFFFGIFIFLFPSCDKHTETTPVNFTLTFKTNYKGQTFLLGKDYTYNDSLNLRFAYLSLFATNIRLIKEDNSEVLLSDAKKIIFNNKTEADASKGVSFTFSNVPADHYKAISFNIGVSKDLNAKIPGNFSADNPLSGEDDYWVAWKSYIFTKTEGFLFKTGATEPESAFVYHTGSDAALRSKTITAAIHLDADHAHSINLDVSKILNGSAGKVDVINKSSSHQTGDEPVMMLIMDNYQTAIQ